MKSFDIPEFYRSPIIGRVKNLRKKLDPRKKDFSPSVLNFGSIEFVISRHFGFCFGVENAIEISYKALEENPDKNIYLLSQMIHNPEVNDDLESQGIQFIQDTLGKQLIPWEEINKEDVVIIPAFGTTIEIEQLLEEKGIETKSYNTTCPFVEKVWNRSEKLGKDEYTIIIHGKHNHEETRATFSHSKKNSPSLVVKNIEESRMVGDFILGKISEEAFLEKFKDRMSKNFDVKRDFKKIGVVNQTTMLATETQEIADYFKQVLIEKYGAEEIKKHFADTRDTLCYATNDNQSATLELLNTDADLAIVVGGYNSSNTSHLVEILEEKFPTFFIKNETEITSRDRIQHFDLHKKALVTSRFLPDKKPLKIILTSGASCPDATVDRVLQKILSFSENAHEINVTLDALEKKYHEV